MNAIQKEISNLRRGQAKARDLESIAKRLGRKPFNSRGIESTYMNLMFTDLRLLSIPHHSGKDIPVGTKNSILNQLEDDVLKCMEYFDKQKKENK